MADDSRPFLTLAVRIGQLGFFLSVAGTFVVLVGYPIWRLFSS